MLLSALLRPSLASTRLASSCSHRQLAAGSRRPSTIATATAGRVSSRSSSSHAGVKKLGKGGEDADTWVPHISSGSGELPCERSTSIQIDGPSQRTHILVIKSWGPFISGFNFCLTDAIKLAQLLRDFKWTFLCNNFLSCVRVAQKMAHVAQVLEHCSTCLWSQIRWRVGLNPYDNAK